MALDTWLSFFLASWIISLSPGAIASMPSGLQYGFVRGYWNAIGLQLAWQCRLPWSRVVWVSFWRCRRLRSMRSNDLVWRTWCTWSSSNGAPCPWT